MASGTIQSNTGVQLNLRLDWSSTPNTSGNYSDVSVNLYLVCYSLNCSHKSGNYLSIDGSSVTFNGGFNLSGGPFTKHLASHSLRVYHNSDGRKTINLSANWVFRGTYSGKYIDSITIGQGVALDNIDRQPGNPSNLRAVGRYEYNDLIQLSWNAPLTYAVTGYELQYRRHDGSKWLDWSGWTTTTNTSVTDRWTTMGKHCQYRVRALNGDLPSSWAESNILTHYGIKVKDDSGLQWGEIKVWDGSSFKDGVIKVWDGTAWTFSK